MTQPQDEESEVDSDTAALIEVVASFSDVQRLEVEISLRKYIHAG